MTKHQPTNIAASVHHRLLNLARERKEEFNLLLIRYGIERFLYRLCQSEYADNFVLKGAILFHLWADVPHRPTRDVDLLERGSPDLVRMESIFRKICRANVQNDGLSFDEKTIRATRIRGQDEYRGIRVHLEARLGTARVRLQIDVGFGNAITPAPRKRKVPCLLDYAAPRLRVYQWETVVAEKYQALVELGITNSRMKDFFDLRYLAKQFEFAGLKLSKAIKTTFARRNTELPKSLPATLSEQFTQDTIVRSRWAAFLRRSRLQDSDLDLAVVSKEIWAFLQPVTNALITEKPFPKSWKPGGPWH